jgi:hypothetical protein
VPRMDHVTHSALLWILVGSAVLAIFVWLVMLSTTAGRQHDAELDRVLSNGTSGATAGGDTEPRIRSVADPAPQPDRFRLLGDPEYGLFLDDAGTPPSSVSGAA